MLISVINQYFTLATLIIFIKILVRAYLNYKNRRENPTKSYFFLSIKLGKSLEIYLYCINKQKILIFKGYCCVV
jgi:hypothetical protein